MNKENCKPLSNCKQSFKAVENFLRRVAFNLGNTQSRTEVKIISCIPIDVTDLQERIFQLQNELADLKEKNKKHNQLAPKQVLCNECMLTTTSLLSVFCPGGCSSADLERNNSLEPIVSQDCSGCIPRIDDVSQSRSNLSKKKGYKKKDKSPLVYRAHTNTKNPFNNKSRSAVAKTPMKPKTANTDENSNQSYLADVIKRQYRQRPLTSDILSLSDYSSPACRDHVSRCSRNLPYVETDVCSCCHDEYQNIDKYMSNNINNNRYLTSEGIGKFDDRNGYYDSNYYDLIPVKEKRVKNRNDIEKYKAREPKKKVIKCWPEKARPKHSYKRVHPTVVNYCTVSSLRDGCEPPAPRGPVRSPNEKQVTMDRKEQAMRVITSSPRRRTELELGPVYAKQVKRDKKDITTITPQRHNVATEPPSAENAARQPATSAATITDPPEDKTEVTLNLIKNMLQSVLTEVKTNHCNEIPPVQSKKDAVVQNAPARGYEYGASQLLQSYTYSPYNMSPFIPSCSHPISCSNYAYPEFSGAPGVPFQQYPLLIQPQKHMCSNYYRNNNFTKPVTKHAASAATNTERVPERSKETEQLIKEIYKSMALSMGESSKDNSFCMYTKPKAAIRNSVEMPKMESDKESRSIAQAISEIFRNTHPRDSTVTGTTDTTLNSYLNPSKTKIVYENSVRKNYKAERNYTRSEQTTKARKDRQTERMYTHVEAEEMSDQSDDTAVEESSSETEIPNAVPIKKSPVKTVEVNKKKSGIFKKMLKIFRPRQRRRKEDIAGESAKGTESDSDDYQTIYSHKAVDATPPPRRVQAVRSGPHSKVFHVKQPQKRKSRTRSPEKHSKNSPYMEQEYRRHWDENLMFHENQRQKHSAPTRQAGDRDQRKSNQRTYYQYYEARPVLVDPIKFPVKMPPNTSRPRYIASKNHYSKHGESNGSRSTPCYDSNQSNLSNVKNTTTGPSGPHFVTAKSTGNRKGTFGKGWLKKYKPQCAQQWKELIING